MKKINISLILVLLTACNSSNVESGSINTEKQEHQIEVVNVESTDNREVEDENVITNLTTLNGTLVIPPAKFATISIIMGGTVRSLNLLPGAYVNKGSLLATLEDPDYIEIQHTYLDSHAQLEYLEAEYKRQQNLANEEVASQKKYQQSKADYLSMRSRKQAAEAQLRLLGVEPSSLLSSGISPYIEIKAPINGYVSNIQANIGKHLEHGEVLCDLIDKKETMIRLVAYEKDLKHLNIGKRIKFRVNGLEEQDFYAILVSVGPNVDEFSRSLELYARVEENNPLFSPGMYVSAQLEE